MSEERIKSELGWDEYYLSLAYAAARKSKDTRQKVGAVVVKGNTIVPGYNGSPRGVDDLKRRWEKPHKYKFVCHAERNALDNAQFDVSGGTLYITHYAPCCDCTQVLLQRGIVRVVCGSISFRTKYASEPEALEMLKDAGINIEILNYDNLYEKITRISEEFHKSAKRLEL